MKVGAAIQGRRKAMGMTLEDLAQVSGVSRAMISEVERDAKSPTIRVLAQIAAGLGCAVTELLASGPSDGPKHLARDDMQTLADDEGGVTRVSLAPHLARHGIDLVEYVFEPGATFVNCPARASDELVAIYVTKGRLRATVGGTENDIAAGESLVYTPDQEVDLVNRGRGETRAVMVLDMSRRGR